MPDFDFSEDETEPWGFFDGQCQACDGYASVNDLSLCQTCAGKLERDMIRQRDWDYSALAFGLSDDDREKLRQRVVRQYGQALELIAPSNNSGKANKS